MEEMIHGGVECGYRIAFFRAGNRRKGSDMASEKPILINGLIGAALEQFRRTIGGDDDQGDTAHRRLDDRRVIIGAGGAGGTDQYGGPAGGLGPAQCDISRSPLVKMGESLYARASGGGQGERGAS